MVSVCEKAAEKAEQEGIHCEIVDLRTLSPLDLDTILDSVKKTGRAIVVYEAAKTCGYGAEIAATISEYAIDYLEAPIVRVAGLDTPFPYSLEYIYMPHPARVWRAIQQVVNY